MVSSEDDSIFLYDCAKGQQARVTNSKKYGVKLVRFTHAQDTVLHASNKEPSPESTQNHAIRYLSLHDNKYIRYFPGHTRRVTSLSLNRLDDLFISASEDQTVRLWDLKMSKCAAQINVGCSPVVGLDPEGMVFAIGIDSNAVRLYDLKKFDGGPFATFDVPSTTPETLKTAEQSPDEVGVWSQLQFSPDGSQIMLTGTGSKILLIDAFAGHVVASLTGFKNTRSTPFEAGYSADGQFVVCGDSDKLVHVWRASDGSKLAQFKTCHTSAEPISKVKWSPGYMMFASTSDTLSMWIPRDAVR